MGLLFTLILGIFILIGAFIVFLTKNNDKFVQFSISLAFGVMIMLIILDLLPEAYEVTDHGNLLYNILHILIGVSIGFLLLKVLDHFIPDHEDDYTTEEDDDKNLKHIGLVSSIALVIHNIVEGMAIYLLISSDFKSGLLACVGVGLHNIPLGMVIASTFYSSIQNKKSTMIIMLGISLSTFMGGLFIHFIPLSNTLEILKSISLTLTIGMLLYILGMELFSKIVYTKYRGTTISGILLGVILLLITLFI